MGAFAEQITRYRNDPKARAEIEEYLHDLGDGQPVTSAYWHAVLREDETALHILSLSEDVFRLREKAKTSPIFADLLASQIKELKALQAKAAQTVT